MHQEHQAGIAQLPRHRQSLSRSKASLLKALLQIDLTATARQSRITEGCDLAEDRVAAPPIGQRICLNEGIELVPGVGDALRRQGHTQRGAIGQGLREQQRVAGAGGGPLGQALELETADSALKFAEAEVGEDTIVQPAEAGGRSRPKTASWVLPWSLKAQIASQR